MMKAKMQLSHVLYRVKDLKTAVEKLRDEGFIVEYGTSPLKAYNALVWFEEGVFVEIYTNSGLPNWAKWLMKIFGYQPVLDRMNKWEYIEKGWCEWSLETMADHLSEQKAGLREQGIPFKFHKAKRKDIKGQILRWELLMPHAIDFPFLMSAYVPNPRPKKINHPNGISGVSKLVVGTENLDAVLLKQLLPDQKGLELIAGKKGLQTIEFFNSSLTIEDILK